LIKYKSIIASSKSLRVHYLKANQIIKQNESLIKLPYSKMINKYGKFNERNYHISNHLFTYKSPESKLLPFTSIKCNQDLNLYDHGIYLTTKTPNEGNIFSIVNNKNSFMAVTNLGTQNLSGLDSTLLFNNAHRGNTFTLCSIANSLQKSKLILLSGKGRDPGQYLYHLIKEKIPLSTSIKDLENKIKQSRHLFLPSPPRIIFEADKDKDFKLQKKLRQYNVPIYHSDNMGHVVMISNFATSEIGVFPDTNRNKSEICSK
ncbi:MAG: hypothetical protein HOJ35_10445, partial [Bdellovibrionales bacterium]|nr:hypothetical protein [Bdellovibrionales bacterium]